MANGLDAPLRACPQGSAPCRGAAPGTPACTIPFPSPKHHYPRSPLRTSRATRLKAFQSDLSCVVPSTLGCCPSPPCGSRAPAPPASRTRPGRAPGQGQNRTELVTNPRKEHSQPRTENWAEILPSAGRVYFSQRKSVLFKTLLIENPK